MIGGERLKELKVKQKLQQDSYNQINLKHLRHLSSTSTTRPLADTIVECMGFSKGEHRI